MAGRPGRPREIAKLTGRVLRVTLLFALPVSAAFICFGEELGGAIYGNPRGGEDALDYGPPHPHPLPRHGGPTRCSKGWTSRSRSCATRSSTRGLSVLLLYTLLPLFGVKGYITVLFFTSFVNASLSISRLSKVVRIPFNFSRWIGRPMLAAGGGRGGDDAGDAGGGAAGRVAGRGRDPPPRPPIRPRPLPLGDWAADDAMEQASAVAAAMISASGG